MRTLYVTLGSSMTTRSRWTWPRYGEVEHLVDTRGKGLGKCTHQWTTNDEKNTNERFRHLVSSTGKSRKTDKKTKEAEKRTDEKEATKLDQT